LRHDTDRHCEDGHGNATIISSQSLSDLFAAGIAKYRALSPGVERVIRGDQQMTMSYFADIPPIRFEGVDSVNPLAYRYYDKDRLVLGRRMEDHLRMAVCYWHTFC